MPSTPWVVQRGKRKQPTITPASRKRVRISDDVGEKTSSRSKPKDQRTLTQIQWVNSPDTSFNDDLNLQEIGSDGKSRPRSGSKATKSRRSMLKKRDSTLTQMDWLGGLQQADQDDVMDDSAMFPTNSTPAPNQIPQIDGNYDSPRKKRPRKQNAKKGQPKSSSPSTPDRETQDYHPTQALGMLDPPLVEPRSNRRKSARIASKVFSDPDQNLDYMKEALLSREDATRLHTPGRPMLEIMDSMDMGEEITPMTQQFQPQTPRRQREIPSSQTPETVTKYRKSVSKKVEASPSKKFGRTPLGEKSTNLQCKSNRQRPETGKSPLKKAKLSPQRSKICVLKVPSRGLLRRSARVEDSQQDIYSLQLTSSSSEKDIQVHQKVSKLAQPAPTDQDDLQVEIPPTSPRISSSDHEMPSSPPGVDTQGSLPELSDLIPARKLDSSSTSSGGRGKEVSQHHQASKQDSVRVKDFGQPHSPKALGPPTRNESTEHGVSDTCLVPEVKKAYHEHPTTPSLHTLESREQDQDGDSDFGSPIANDTQFNTGLMQRTSSPDAMEESEYVETPTQIISKMGPPPLPNGDQQYESAPEALLPTPRLVGRISPASRSDQSNRDIVPEQSQAYPAADEHDSYATVATVPINANAGIMASSSPPLPPVRTKNQRGVYPASMPRPSQISTQDPTQHYLSSLPQPQPTQHHTQIEPIIIKDSSSARLTQIPKYESQSQGPNLQLVPSFDTEIDDLDLDPASAAYAVQSARKPTGLLRNQTGSSLRSIHQSSEISRGRQHITPTSSSPTRQTSALQAMAMEQVSTSTETRQSSNRQEAAQSLNDNGPDAAHDSDGTSSPISSPDPPDLKRKYDPLPGFDNETQSNFTQSGHITAAYIHRQRESGKWPDWFIPEPFQLQNFKRSKKRASNED